MKQLVKAVASVSELWFTLGLYLGLEPAELNEIRTTHHLDGVNTLQAMMFDKWLTPGSSQVSCSFLGRRDRCFNRSG